MPERLKQHSPSVGSERLLLSACAALLAVHRLPLADLASALDVSTPTARELVARVGDRPAQVGYTATEDGNGVCVWPLTEVGDAVSRVAGVETEEGISAEQLEVLCIIVTLGEATRTQVKRYRGEDCETILGRLVRRGLLAKVRDEREIGGPNVCRVTAKALRAAGLPNQEKMRAAITAALAQPSLERASDVELTDAPPHVGA